MAKGRQARADAERGVPVLVPTGTVAAYLAAWLETVVKPSARMSTYDTYRHVAERHVVPAIGSIRLAQLTSGHVEAMLSGLVASGLSESTARHVRSILAAALAAAERDYGLSRNVARLARPPKSSAPPFEPERLTVADVRRVLAAMAGDRCEPHVMFSIATGVRQGELLALRYSDLDLDGRSVAIRHSVERGKGVARIARPKTDRGSRTLVLSNLALGAIEMESRFQASERELAGDRWQDLGLVFASRTGTIQARAITGSHLRARLAAAGLPPIRWHGLRRLFAALLLDQGVPLHRIRDLLGHTNVGITEHCAYPMAEALARDMGAVDRALGDELG